VLLRHVHGLHYPECAAVLGQPAGTVKSHVHRGIALLRTALQTRRDTAMREAVEVSR
jgi:RNA polymerase sigma-70 factor (ECF subfamily)